MRKNTKPDSKNHRPEPEYIAQLVELAKQQNGLTSQEEVANRIGVARTTLKQWLSGRSECSYPAQYTLERLAGVA